MSENTTPEPEKQQYNQAQRTAMLQRMFSSIREDLGSINSSIVSREMANGFLLTHDEAAIISAKLMRATAAMAALAKIFDASDNPQVMEEINKLNQAARADQIVDALNASLKK